MHIKTTKCLKCEVGEVFSWRARTHSFTLSPLIYISKQEGWMGNEVGHSDVYAPSPYISSFANQRGIHHILACSSSSFLNSFCLVYRLITKRRVVRKITCGSDGQKMRVFSVCAYILGMTLSWIKSAGCDAATHSSAPAGAIHSRAEHIFRPRDAYMHITYVYICMRRSHLENRLAPQNVSANIFSSPDVQTLAFFLGIFHLVEIFGYIHLPESSISLHFGMNAKKFSKVTEEMASVEIWKYIFSWWLQSLINKTWTSGAVFYSWSMEFFQLHSHIICFTILTA